MIRVALLSTDVNPSSGWGNITNEVCRELFRRDDIAFDLHLPVGASVDGDIPFASHVHLTLPPWVGSFRHRPYRVLPFLFPRLKMRDTDVVHALIEFPYAILAWNLAQGARVPFVITAQGTYGVVPLLHWLDRWFYGPALERAAFITTPSRFSAEAMWQAGRLQKNISVLHNAVNYARFQRSVDLTAVRFRFGLPENARIVLGVGALKMRKGFDVLLRAFARVIQREPRAHLVIAGDGGGRASLQGLATSLGIAAKVHLVGSVQGDDLVGLYQLCEVYAHLPRNVRSNFEGFGIVYLEAAACGKPVVAARSGGVADAVMDGKTGFMVDEEDDVGAAAGILRLLQDPGLARSLGEAGRTYAAQHTWSWYADKLVGLYEEAMSRYQTSRRRGAEVKP